MAAFSHVIVSDYEEPTFRGLSTQQKYSENLLLRAFQKKLSFNCKSVVNRFPAPSLIAMALQNFYL
jgi:hypothetical protein